MLNHLAVSGLTLAALLALLTGCARTPMDDWQDRTGDKVSVWSDPPAQDYSHIVYRGGRDPRTGLATVRNF